MGIKEDMRDEHQVLYGRAESFYCTTETNITLLTTLELRLKL